MKHIVSKLAVAIVTLALITSTHTTWAQKKNTTITLVVNTAGINQGNINQMTRFYDSNGNSDGPGDHSNFLSLVDLDKWVFWEGEVEDASGNAADQVNITLIKKKTTPNNKSLLKKDEYPGKRGKVKAKVHKYYIEGDESYAIHFEVVRNGVSTTYVIDPKLKIRN